MDGLYPTFDIRAVFFTDGRRMQTQGPKQIVTRRQDPRPNSAEREAANKAILTIRKRTVI